MTDSAPATFFASQRIFACSDGFIEPEPPAAAVASGTPEAAVEGGPGSRPLPAESRFKRSRFNHIRGG